MSTEDEELPLEVYWDDIRVARHRASPPPAEEAQLPDFSELAEPNDLVIGTSANRVLAIIKPDGTIQFGPEYRPNEAAQVFWEAMGHARMQMEERFLLFQHMESVLARVGAADLEVETLRLRAADGDTDAGQAAGPAMVRLERLWHQAIELGRGLARRPDIPVPAIPERIPRTIEDNEASDYQGQEGLEEPVEPLAGIGSTAGAPPDPFVPG